MMARLCVALCSVAILCAAAVEALPLEEELAAPGSTLDASSFIDENEKKSIDAFVEQEAKRRDAADATLAPPHMLGESDALASSECDRAFKLETQRCMSKKSPGCMNQAKASKEDCLSSAAKQPMSMISLGESEAATSNTAAAKDEHRQVPLSVKCYHAFDGQIEAAKATFRKEQAAAKKKNHAQAVLAKIRTKEQAALTDSTKQIKADHTAIANKQYSFKEKHSETTTLFDDAKDRLSTYRKAHAQVRSDAAHAKVALKTYLRYKQQYIQASADSSKPMTTEIMQYKRISAQYLKSYHTLKKRIKDNHTRAAAAQFSYKKLSTKYHKNAALCNKMAEEINKVSDAYASELAKHKILKARFEATDRKYLDAGMAFRQHLKNSRDASSSEKTLMRQKAAARVKYWELVDMQHKYSALAAKEKVVGSLQSAHYGKLSSQVASFQNEIDANVKTQSHLIKQQKLAEASATVFKKNYNDQGCAKAEEEEFKLPSQAEQRLAAKKNKQTQNPLDAATKASPTAVMYHKYYRQFLSQYRTSLTQNQAKSTLGEKGLTNCQYYTKLMSEYSDLGTTHLKYRDWVKKNGSQKDPEAFKKLLLAEQKSVLNDERMRYYKRMADHACNGGSEANKQTDMTALLQISAGVGQAERQSLSSLDLVKPEDKAKAEKEMVCEKQKRIATASLEAAQTAKLSEQKLGAYVKMLKADHLTASAAQKNAATRRDAARSKEIRYKKIATDAKKDKDRKSVV